MQQKLLIIFICLGIIFPVFVNASSVVPVDLETMSVKSGKIFHGKCVSVNVKEDERGLTSTEVTYDVIRSVKGEVGESVTFKVFGHVNYYPGKEDVLFLYKESPWGFTSPIGLWQGEFPVVREGGNPKLLRKSRAYKNAIRGGLFKAVKAEKREITTPDELLDKVENILEQ